MSELLSIGQTCSHPACSLVDFLPIKCQHCTLPYCSDHYKPQVHSCPKFDATQYDRIAPACPFCQKPVAFAAGVDPNVAMEAHFDFKCEVVGGGALVGVKAKGGAGGVSPRCARGKCNKVLVAPIRCPTCSQQFCAEHRFPTTHKCITTSASTTPAAKSRSATPSSSRTPPTASASSSSTTPNRPAPRQNAAQAAMNRAAASVNAKSTIPAKSTSTSAPVKSTAPAATSSLTNPFSKTERWGPSRSPSTPDQRIDNHPYSTSTSASTPTSAPSTSSGEPVNKPQPIIPQSFIPRSIFGTA